ncbi:MAG: acyltransferase [Edaphobacter sp.]|nr:acyltransferase [Edaphobacter sp.]
MKGQKPTSETREPITSGTRSNIVDIVKGIAIALVVYGHTAQGMIHRDWWVGPGAIFSDEFIYSFHMPAFFFVSGLFVMSSLAKRGSRQFAVDKVKTILYPYLLFAIINVTIEPLIGRFKSGTKPFHWSTFLISVADGEASWFLFVLFLCLMVALMTARVPAWLRFLVAMLVALLPPHGPFFVNQLLHEFCFLAGGMWVGTHIFRLERMRATSAALDFVLLAAFQTAMIYALGAAALWEWPYIILGLTGTAGLFLLAKLLDRHRVGNGIAWVGRASLAVFLLSAYVQGATREVLLRVFHTREFWLQLFLPTLFAILLPAIAWHQQDRWRIGWLFRWPF